MSVHLVGTPTVPLLEMFWWGALSLSHLFSPASVFPSNTGCTLTSSLPASSQLAVTTPSSRYDTPSSNPPSTQHYGGTLGAGKSVRMPWS